MLWPYIGRTRSEMVPEETMRGLSEDRRQPPASPWPPEKVSCGELHIQTVNSRHEQSKTFLRRHQGIATRYLDSYLRWFHLAVLPRHETPRAILAAAGFLPVTRHA